MALSPQSMHLPCLRSLSIFDINSLALLFAAHSALVYNIIALNTQGSVLFSQFPQMRIYISVSIAVSMYSRLGLGCPQAQQTNKT